LNRGLEHQRTDVAPFDIMDAATPPQWRDLTSKLSGDRRTGADRGEMFGDECLD
jgi:hypothetical protein